MALLNSQDSDDYRALAEQLYVVTTYEEATELVDRVRGLTRNDQQLAEASIDLGWGLYEAFGRQIEALELASTALRLSPEDIDDPTVLVFRGRGQSLVAECLWSTDYHAASEAARLGLEQLEEALARNQGSDLPGSAFRSGALLNQWLGQSDKAIRWYERAFQLPLTARELSRLRIDYGWCLYTQTDRWGDALELARAELDVLAEEQTGDPTVLTFRGEHQSLLAYCTWPSDPAAGNDAARLGLGNFEQVLTANTDGYDARIACEGAASLHRFLNEPEKAARLCQRFLALQLNDFGRSRGSVDYSDLLDDLDRQKEAYEHAQRGLALLPAEDDNPDTQIRRGFGESVVAKCTWADQPERGAEAARRGLRGFGRVLARSPNGYHALSAYREMIFLNGLLNEREEAVRLTKLCLQLPMTELERGVHSIEFGIALHGTLGNNEDALELVLAGLRLLPDDADDDQSLLSRVNGHWVLVMCTSSAKSDQAAEAAQRGLQYCERLLARKPTRQVEQAVSRLAADMHLEMQQPSQATPYFRRWLQLDPPKTQLPVGLFQLGTALRQTGDLTEASRILEEALKNIESDKSQLPYIRYEQGLIELEMERFANAKQAFRGAIEALETVMDSRERTAVDVEWIRSVQRDLGHACYSLDQYDEAISAYEQALADSDSGNRANVLLWLGCCHNALEDYAKARDCFEEVLRTEGADSGDRESATQWVKGCHWEIAQANVKENRFRAAASICQSLISIHTDDDEYRCSVLLWLAYCRAKLWQRKATRRSYEMVLASKGATAGQREHAREGLHATNLVHWVLFRWLMSNTHQNLA